MKLNILGTPYEIRVKKYSDEEVFERRSIVGYCNGLTKKMLFATCIHIRVGNTKTRRRLLLRKKIV